MSALRQAFRPKCGICLRCAVSGVVDIGVFHPFGRDAFPGPVIVIFVVLNHHVECLFPASVDASNGFCQGCPGMVHTEFTGDGVRFQCAQLYGQKLFLNAGFVTEFAVIGGRERIEIRKNIAVGIVVLLVSKVIRLGKFWFFITDTAEFVVPKSIPQ